MSSKRRIRRKACDGKVRHLDQDAAWFALGASKKLGEMRPYRCRFCKGWHVGHP